MPLLSNMNNNQHTQTGLASPLNKEANYLKKNHNKCSCCCKSPSYKLSEKMLQTWIFSVLMKQNIIINQSEITDIYQVMAETGNTDAQFVFGKRLQNGKGINCDLVKAHKWIKLAADKGHPQAQNALGFILEIGYGVPKNPTIAVSYYLRASVQGDGPSMYNIALCYQEGREIPQDNTQYITWMKCSRDAGYLPAIKLCNKFLW